MRKAQSHPYIIKTFVKGANYDIDKEIGGIDETGEYIDARNMRNTEPGKTNQQVKINGESNVYISNYGTGNYECIGTILINNHIVEFWADPVEESLIRIDGDVVLKSPNFPISITKPLQLKKSENCLGGEVFITDDNSPMIFNIQDLIDNKLTTKYFGDFFLPNYTAQTQTPLDHPIFVELVSATGSDDGDISLGGEVVHIGTGGMKAGQSQYVIRYGTDTGDRTRFSVATPMIPVPAYIAAPWSAVPSAQISPIYPYMKTRGTESGTSSNYGIKIAFRVTNLNNYDFIEVKRLSYSGGVALGLTPASDIIYKHEIEDGEIGIVELIDDGASILETVTDDEDTDTMSAIERAKTNRYYNQRWYLMNVKYASRDIEDTVTFKTLNGKEMYPLVENIGTMGYKDVYNIVNKKAHISGERYGWGVTVFDGMGEESFTKVVTNFNNYTYPLRRKEASAETIARCGTSGQGGVWKGLMKAANTDGGTTLVHEVFDTGSCVVKGTSDAMNITTNCGNYMALNPVSQGDTNVSGYNFNPCANVLLALMPPSFVAYNPKGYGVDYYARGMFLEGIDTYPIWAKAFSINRRRAANRVIAQGIGFYRLILGGGKSKNTLWFYSADTEAGVVDMTDVIATPGNYNIEFVAPYGFWSEVYSGYAGYKIDMITYAKMIEESTANNINPGDNEANVGIQDGGSGYVAYGTFRNGAPAPTSYFAGNEKPLTLIGISGVTSVTEGRNSYYEIELTNNIYETLSGSTNSEGARGFHEPMYVINIVRDVNNVPTLDVDDYIETGHYQKIESIIGKSDGTKNQQFALVDERWEDCIPNRLDPGVASLDSYVYVEDENGNEYSWIDVTYKSAMQIFVIKAGLAPGQGVYTSEDIEGTQGWGHHLFYSVDRFFKIIFSDNDYIPPVNSIIKVRYDNTVPIKVYGGDGFVGDTVFAPIDKQIIGNDPSTQIEVQQLQLAHFHLNLAFPFWRWQMQITNIVMADKDHCNGGTVVDLGYVRQLLCMFTSESRVNPSYIYGLDKPNEFYPMTNYIQRPVWWTVTGYVANNIYSNYGVDYDDGVYVESSSWEYGGFRITFTYNSEYSNESEASIMVSKPLVGYIENQEFCNRIIWTNQRPINVANAIGLRSFPSMNVFDISDSQGSIKYSYDSLTSKGNNLYAITDTGICLLMTDKRTIYEKSGEELAITGSDDSSNILEQIWLSKEIGMFDEMWRTAAEANNTLYFGNNRSYFKLQDNQVTDIGGGYHSKLYFEYLVNIKSGYGTKLNGVYDILHNEYWTTFATAKIPITISTVLIDGSHLFEIGNIENGDVVYINQIVANTITETPLYSSGATLFYLWNKHTSYSLVVRNGNTSMVIGTLLPGEYAKFELDAGWIMTIIEEKDAIQSSVFVFSEAKQAWLGYFDYRFDKFLAIDNLMYGMRQLETWQIGVGNEINGDVITAEISQTVSPAQIAGKEFIRIRMAGENQPTKIQFFKNFTNWKNSIIFTEINTVTQPFALRNYDGWEGYIPRGTVLPYDRFQGRLLIYKIIHSLDEDFGIVDVGIQYKQLK